MGASRLRAVAVTLAFVAAACGSDDSIAVDAAPAETASTTVPTTSTLPTASTTPPISADVDTSETALQLVNSRWSTVEPWGDGWVRLEAVATGGGLIERESPAGQLIPDEIFDAIEAAGATDTVSAYDALGEAGLLTAMLSVLAENPGLLDEILSGPGALTLQVSTSIDGIEWDTADIPFLSGGQFSGSASDGSNLALSFLTVSGMSVATTTDLVEWTVTDVALAGDDAPEFAELHRIDDGWLVHTSNSADAIGWIIEPDQTIRSVPAPAQGRYHEVESTDAGLVVATAEDEQPVLFFSDDGISWEARSVPFDAAIGGLAAVDDGLAIAFPNDGPQPRVMVGTPDAREWEAVDLPDEITYPMWIRDHHHRGVAQFTSFPGRGRGGAIGPAIPHTTVIEHDGVRIEWVWEGFDQTITAFDLETGAEIGWNMSTADGVGVLLRILDDGDAVAFYDDDGSEIVRMPQQLAETANAEATEVARASLTPEELALYDRQYVLVTTDGTDWTGLVAPRGPSGERAWVVALNGARVLLTDGSDFWVVEP